MPKDLTDWHATVGGFVARPRFEEYSRKYADHFAMTREDGILELRMHTDGGPAQFGFAAHNAWGQAWQEIGNDPDNEVLILTGTGDQWIATDDLAPEDRDLGELMPMAPPPDFAYEHTYYDAIKLLENMVFGIDIPTIAALNGPSPAHTEFALLCDITLAAEHATILDPHFPSGVVPGDGLQLTLQETLGTKRAAYHLYTADPIDAPTALELGLVNEVLPLPDLLPRAWEIARTIMRQPRAARRFTHAVAQRPWKRRLVQDLGFGLAHEMAGISADRRFG
ncbi:enoyl-CoA hydratase/isomerase family protein [Nocardia aurantia]|uniref:6-oxocamphor hydrolase n=1 Tax=Nocardia aurantia TaxID=2585199 RepID=A0A7K0DW94_9NOCA|nr:enoyl-CoA hydratase/isomerase family protein [Nocardia aurantia]MQY29104.1 6-oxocamphor hydrolase [Nocardia aurantia]